MAILRALLAVIAAAVGMVLTLPLVVAGLPFWGMALLTRALCRLLTPRVVPWQQIVQYDPTFGWKPKAHLNTHCLAEPAGDVFDLRTDAQGWRGKAGIAESDVLVFGDSFAFGYGVDERACFSELPPRLRIKAIGAPGYNMVQELLWMRRLASQLSGKLVVWFIYVGNDLYDNLQPNLQHYRRPFVRRLKHADAWEIVTTHISPAKWPYNIERQVTAHREMLTHTYSSTSISQRAYSACDFLVEEAHNICSTSGARLVVMTIPDILELSPEGVERLSSYCIDATSFDADLADKKIDQVCARLGVPFVPAKLYLNERDYNRGDRHWNARGHQRIAQVLSTLYERDLSLPHAAQPAQG